MSQSAFDRLLEKYLSGNCTKEEEKVVLEWYEQLISNSGLDLSEEERSAIETRIWQSIRTDEPVEVPAAADHTKIIPFRKRLWRQIAAAACLLLIAGAAWLVLRREDKKDPGILFAEREHDQRVSNDTKNSSELMLPDSSVVILHPGAVIQYPRAFDGNTREVILTGNAFFKVFHDPGHPFKVYLSGSLVTEVLGTSFNIVQDPESSSIEVGVITGKVRVFRQAPAQSEQDQRYASVILTPNKKVTFNTSTSRFTTGLVADPQPLAKPKQSDTLTNEAPDNRFVFEDEPLKQVLQTLGNAYGIPISAESEKLAQYHFTGNISKYDLFRQLTIICQTTHTQYEISDTMIIVKEIR